jgi:asparagine synthase (glutamine-hydrolysing)
MFLQDIGLHHEGGPLYEPLVRQAAARHGVRLLLSGWGGDELISFHGRVYLADLLWRGHWRRMARGLAEQMSGITTWGERLRVAYRTLLLPSLPPQLAARLGNRPAAIDYTIALSVAFAAYVEQQANSRHAPWSVRPSVRAAQIALLDNGHLPLRIEQCATAGADDHVVYVYPLLDRRIVEFALGVPPHLYVQEKYGRYLFRRTLRGILPDAVRWSHVKYEPRRVERLIDLTQAAVDTVWGCWACPTRISTCLASWASARPPAETGWPGSPIAPPCTARSNSWRWTRAGHGTRSPSESLP